MSEKTHGSSGVLRQSHCLGLRVGEQLELTRRLGTGKLGEVLLAEHPVLARRYAVKMLRPALTRPPAAQERLRRAVQEISAFEHRGVVSLYDFGTAAHGTYYLVSEYLRCTPLTRSLSGGQAIPLEQALELLARIAEILAAAHERGLMHGDLKPSNILLAEQPGGLEQPLLNDFRLSQALALDPSAEDPVAHLRIFSTLEYLSPEVIASGTPTPASDIYSLGALGYRMVCGVSPFSDKPKDVLRRSSGGPPVPPSRRLGYFGAVPSRVDRVLLRCMATDPAERGGSMAGVARELGNLSLLAAGALTDIAEPEDEPSDLGAPLPPEPGQVRDLLYGSINEMARLATAQDVAGDGVRQALEELAWVDGDLRLELEKVGEMEERMEQVRQGLGEREAVLHYAITDLSLTRDSKATVEGETRAVRELDYQVVALRESLDLLDRHRNEVLEIHGADLARQREEVAARERRRGKCHRRLQEKVEEVRHQISGSGAAALHDTITRCRQALSSLRPS